MILKDIQKLIESNKLIQPILESLALTTLEFIKQENINEIAKNNNQQIKEVNIFYEKNNKFDIYISNIYFKENIDFRMFK